MSDGSHGAFNGELSIPANVSEIGTLNEKPVANVFFMSFVLDYGVQVHPGWVRGVNGTAAIYARSNANSRVAIIGAW